MPTTPAKTEIVPYAGWARNLRIANADVEMIVTLDVGPRVIRYAAPGGRNLFGETADQLGKAGEPHWMPRGGHRLWTAPEDKTRTYAPDNRAVEHRVLSSDASGVAVRLPSCPTSLTAFRRSSTSLSTRRAAARSSSTASPTSGTCRFAYRRGRSPSCHRAGRRSFHCR